MREKIVRFDKLPEDNGQEEEWVKTKGGFLFRKPKKKEEIKFPIKGEGFIASEPFHGETMPGQGVEFKPGASTEEKSKKTDDELKQAKEGIETAFKNAKKEKEI